MALGSFSGAHHASAIRPWCVRARRATLGGEMFETILIAVDGADQGADLVRAAMAVTHPRRSEVWVANVLRTPVAHGDRPASGPARTAAAAIVEDAARMLRQSGYRANGVVRELTHGGVADELVRIIVIHLTTRQVLLAP